MLAPGIERRFVADYLLGCPWFTAYSQNVFEVAPDQFVEPLLEEMARSKAVYWEGDRLYASSPHRRPSANWMDGIAWPADWPPIGQQDA
jgi:hydroxyacylglutathione hydrolase